jgi:hypothetical protein
MTRYPPSGSSRPLRGFNTHRLHSFNLPRNSPYAGQIDVSRLRISPKISPEIAGSVEQQRTQNGRSPAYVAYVGARSESGDAFGSRPLGDGSIGV